MIDRKVSRQTLGPFIPQILWCCDPFHMKEHRAGVCGTLKGWRHQLIKGESPALPLLWPPLKTCPSALLLSQTNSIYSVTVYLNTTQDLPCCTAILLHSNHFVAVLFERITNAWPYALCLYFLKSEMT